MCMPYKTNFLLNERACMWCVIYSWHFILHFSLSYSDLHILCPHEKAEVIGKPWTYSSSSSQHPHLQLHKDHDHTQFFKYTGNTLSLHTFCNEELFLAIPLQSILHVVCMPEESKSALSRQPKRNRLSSWCKERWCCWSYYTPDEAPFLLSTQTVEPVSRKYLSTVTLHLPQPITKKSWRS